MTVCRFCKKPLRGAESVAVGYGPTCAKKNGLVFASVKTLTKRFAEPGGGTRPMFPAEDEELINCKEASKHP